MPKDEPSQTQPLFRPRRWLRGGHIQTVAGNFLPRKNDLPAPENRLFQVDHDAQVLCHCHWQPDDKRNTMTVLIVHGLEGSSGSQYVIGTGNKAWRKGMNVVRMNMRNCGNTEMLAPTLYHSGLSADVGVVVRALIERDELRRIALVGYSMGGNLVLKLAGEWSTEAPEELKAVVGISPAIDLSPSADALHEPRNWLYELRFMLGLRSRFRRKAAMFPDRYDPRHIENLWTIRDFDNGITARYGGFKNAEDYYSRASSARVIDRIAVSTLIVHSTDDPFILMTPETRAKLLANPHIKLLETEHGGHCAFLEDPNGYDGRWAEKQCIEWLEHF